MNCQRVQSNLKARKFWEFTKAQKTLLKKHRKMLSQMKREREREV